jgi:prophage antirepressor-like protein
MANPRNFFNKCVKLNVKYEYLNEAIECIGKQALARMFEGHSARGQENTLSAATIDNWLVTLKYIIDNPDHIDNDKNVSTNISPTEKWNDFVNLIKTPIPDETVTSWLNMSNSNLSKEAEKHGMLLGIKNSKAIKNLHERMLLMIERRKQLWNDTSETKTHSVDEIEKIDYNCMNIFELKNLAKTRKIVVGPNKKENIIKLLEDYDKNDCDKTDENDEENIQYNNMVLKSLKKLAKDRGFNCYNNLNKDSLVELHTKYDIEQELINKLKEEELEKQQNEKKETDDKKLNEVFKFNDKDIRVIGTFENPWFITKDICDILEISNNRQAISNIPDKWKGVTKSDTLGGSQEFSIINEPALYKLIMRSNKPNAEKFQEWICEDVLPSIRKKGTYTLQQPSDFILQRPMRELTMLSEIDIEAETIEMSCDWLSYTNCCCIYVAYIGDGLIKIGYSDCNISKRIEKHKVLSDNSKQMISMVWVESQGEEEASLQ